MLIEREGDEIGDCYCGQGGLSTPVIACVDAPPAFEFAEHILDFVTLALKIFVKVCRY